MLTLPTPSRKRARLHGGAELSEADPKSLAVKDAKPIVDEIKAKLKGKKFYPGLHAEARLVCFSTPRFPFDKAKSILGVGADGKPAVRIFEGEQIETLLRLKRDTLKATLYKKPHRFSKPGATATRLGSAPLKLRSMEVRYKAGTLSGCIRCINVTDRSLHGTQAPDVVSSGADKALGSKLLCVVPAVPTPSNTPAETIELKARERPSVQLAGKATAGKRRRILEFSGTKLKVVCPDSIAFMNFHRVLQTCIQACKGINATRFLFQFKGHTVSSDDEHIERFLSELTVGDVVSYTSEFNRSYGNLKVMNLAVTGACAVPASMGETPWNMLQILDDGLLPRCIQATAAKSRDTANWRLCHMRFDLVVDPGALAGDDLGMVRFGADYSASGMAGASSLRRRGPGKFRREAVVRRMSLDLAGELQYMQSSNPDFDEVPIER